MGDEWIGGAARIPRQGGAMEGPRHVRSVVWHTSESPTSANPSDVGRYVISRGSEYHLLWNPYTGDMCQLIPASQSARSLRNHDGWRTNRIGSVRIQVCVIGRAAEAPLVTSPLKRWNVIRDWLAGWGIPEQDARDWTRSRDGWLKSGHTDHRSAPGNDHHDPGSIKFDLLFGKSEVPSEEGDDMLIVRQGSKTPLLVHGDRTTLIDETSAESMQKAGVMSSRVTFDVYDRLKRDDNQDRQRIENRLDKMIALLESMQAGK